MAKNMPDSTLDIGLNAMLRNVCTRVDVCSSEPTNYTEATSTYSLADVTVDSSDFTLGDGDVSGRKATFAQQTGVDIDADGTTGHLAFTDGSSAFFHATTTDAVALSTPGTMTINACDLEITDLA